MTSEQLDRLTQAGTNILDVIDDIIDEQSSAGDQINEIENLCRYKEALYDVMLNFGY